MANRRRKITRRAGASRHFLIGRTEPRPAEPVSEYGLERACGALRAAFPDLLCGRRLEEAAVERLNRSERFAALVLRPDEDPEEGEGRLLAAAAGCLDAVCRRTDAFWGVEETGLLAGYWPDRGAAETLDTARRLQEDLRGLTGRSATVGVAAFPTLDFQRRQTVENARKALDHAAFFGPGSRMALDAVSLNISGDQLYERGDLAAAIREFERAIALDSGNVNVHNSLGVCYGVRGEHERALEAFSAALRLNPGEYMALYNIGLVHSLKGRRDTALGFFLQAHALRSDVFEILFQTGKLYLEMGQPQSARSFLEHAARLRSRSGGIFRLLGDCYAALGLQAKAVRAYQKAVKANPADSQALSALGGLYDETGENPEIAAVLCRESVQLDPQNPLFRRRLGALLLKMDRLEEALAEFEHLDRLGQNAAEEIRSIRERLAQRRQAAVPT